MSYESLCMGWAYLSMIEAPSSLGLMDYRLFLLKLEPPIRALRALTQAPVAAWGRVTGEEDSRVLHQHGRCRSQTSRLGTQLVSGGFSICFTEVFWPPWSVCTLDPRGASEPSASPRASMFQSLSSPRECQNTFRSCSCQYTCRRVSLPPGII